MSERDFWERMNAATDRAIDMARADRILERVVLEVKKATKPPALLGSDASGKVPHYTDDDGPELITGAGGWYVKPRERNRR